MNESTALPPQPSPAFTIGRRGGVKDHGVATGALFGASTAHADNDSKPSDTIAINNRRLEISNLKSAMVIRSNAFGVAVLFVNYHSSLYPWSRPSVAFP